MELKKKSYKFVRFFLDFVIYVGLSQLT